MTAWADHLAAATGRMSDLLADLAPADLDRAVPACPGWSVRDLVAHLGHIHRWAAHAVLSGDPHVVAEPLPAGVDPAGWYAEVAEHLVAVLGSADPGAPAWSFSGPHQTAGFWQRRQVHEVVLHTYDVLAAVGRTEEWQVEPILALDGVTEVRDVFYPRQVRLGRTQPLPRPLRLVATDLAAPPVLLGEPGPAPVELAAPAADLLLVLWHRLPCPDPAAAPLTAHALAP